MRGDTHAESYRAAGMDPPWERVWRQGVDVTHEDPETWPWPYSMYAAGGRGRKVQADILTEHERAVGQRAVRGGGLGSGL